MKKPTLHYYRFHVEKIVDAISPTVIPYYDLTMVLEGRMEYRVNNRRISLEAGSAVLMPPATKRERIRTEGKTTYVSFNFRTEETIDLPLVLDGAVGKEIKMMVYACNEIDLDHGAYAREALADLTSAILNALYSYVTRSQNSPLTERILAYIREHYREPLLLGKIAAEMAYSVAYCDQVFRKDVGVSIVHYLIDYRVAKVKEYLIENVLSLQEIAERTGFGECNYLSRQFRHRTGVSPLRFRKQFNG
ncbi:MAG: helix-turn-helix transcriptional regulator [Clostridia bacterium]|nr:helix-turn-helix transcriptional regulator [Clostridia bacterium]